MVDETQDDEITRNYEPVPAHLLEPDSPQPDEGDDLIMLSARNFSEWVSQPHVAPFLEVEMPPLPTPSVDVDVLSMTERLWAQLCYLCGVC